MKIAQGTARATGITTDIDGMTKAEIAAKLGYLSKKRSN